MLVDNPRDTAWGARHPSSAALSLHSLADRAGAKKQGAGHTTPACAMLRSPGNVVGRGKDGALEVIDRLGG
jgi:hypothetical protein